MLKSKILLNLLELFETLLLHSLKLKIYILKTFYYTEIIRYIKKGLFGGKILIKLPQLAPFESEPSREWFEIFK